MQKETKSSKVLNILGVLGYIGNFMQWMWVIILYLPSIIESPIFQQILPEGEDKPIPEPVISNPAIVEIPSVVSVLVLIASILLVGFLIYLMVMSVTRSAAKAGQMVTHKPAIVVGELVAQKTPLKAKEKRQISANIVFVLKILLALTPLVLILPVSSFAMRVSFEFVIVIGLILAAWTLLSFIVQYIASRLMKISYLKVR